jgi:hypothetical protein
MRDAHGRFVRQRMYRLVFDDGHNEDIRGDTPSQAVAKRKGGRGSLLPHTITDLTSMERLRAPRVAVLDRPLLRRIEAHSAAVSVKDMIARLPYGWEESARECWDD